MTVIMHGGVAPATSLTVFVVLQPGWLRWARSKPKTLARNAYTNMLLAVKLWRRSRTDLVLQHLQQPSVLSLIRVDVDGVGVVAATEAAQQWSSGRKRDERR
jgi:hypothetical protein